MADRTLKVVKPNPAVWKAALQAAGGDVSRLRVVSETEVVIENKPQPGRGQRIGR